MATPQIPLTSPARLRPTVSRDLGIGPTVFLVIVTNCSNNYGPRQHSEKLIPSVIRHALAGEPIPIYGNGQNVRDWLYVGDHVDGLMATLQQSRPGETYLFGERWDIRNLDLAHMICRIHDTRAPSSDGQPYARQIKDRPGHDFCFSSVRCTQNRSAWLEGKRATRNRTYQDH